MSQHYFKDRAEAGRLIAEKLAGYQKENCAVIALNEGGIIIGAQVAMKLHATLSILLTESVTLPGEPNPIGGLTSKGNFTYNNMFSVGELEGFVSEYHGFIDQSRMEKMHRLNRLLGKDGEINREFLKRHIVILVSDGLTSGFSLDIAKDFLKPITVHKLIIATPVASVSAVDRMHLIGDEICCLSVVQDFVSVDHYYDSNYLPTYEEIIKIMRNITLNWVRH